jgi:signal transduction histidine kinase
MNIFSLSSILASSFCILLAFFVVFRDRRRATNRSFAIITTLAGIWSLFPFLATIAKNDVIALQLDRIAYFAAIFVPATFLDFVFYIIGEKKSAKENLALNISYLFSLLFFALNFTPLLIKGVLRFQPQFYVVPGPAYPLFVMFFGFICLYAFVKLIFKYQVSSGTKRNQLKYIFIAFVFAYISGLMHFLPAYLGRWAEPFPHDLLLIAFASIISYAILQHRLLDIEIVIKKTVVYSILTALLTGIFVSVILISNYWIRNIMGQSSIWVGILAAFAVALAFQPLRDAIQKTVDNTFFRARYDYQRILRKYSHALARPMTDLNRYSRIAPYLLWKAMKLAGVSVMVLDRANHRYLVRAGEGEGESLIGQSIPENSTLALDLTSRHAEIDREEINFTLKSSEMLPSEERKKLEEILAEMDKLKAVLIIPCISESEYFHKPTLLSTINLGRKLSEEAFSKEDIDFLKTLANQAALVIEYAFILEELKKNQEQIIKSEKLAALGTTTAGIAHELKNPLTYLTTLSQILPKRWEDQSFREGVMQMFPAEVERMRIIVEGILDYSRSREMTLQPVEISEVTRKTLALLAYDLRKSNVSVKENYEHSLKIQGDPNRLIQVFVNLFSNAIQAMGGTGGELAISTKNDGERVQIRISDTGPGIPSENLSKIFDPFYSTKESGTGLGLAIVRKIIDEHKGLIGVESTVGQGTVFTVNLPATSS